jgi:hypothetical protein
MGKLKTYVSYQKMKDLFKGTKSRFPQNKSIIMKEQGFLKIFRILCRNYLKTTHITHVFNSLKIKDKSKILHI